MAALRVAVMGAGAIGNEVIKNLVLLGVGEVQVFDFDTVERHNLTRSVLLRESDVGRPKALCVAARAADLDPAVRVHAVPGDIADTLRPSRLRSLDLVVAAVDNFEARIRINQLCLLTGTSWVNAAIDSRNVGVDVFAFERQPVDDGEPPACYECTLPESVYQRLAQRRSCGGLRRAAARERLIPTTTITASLAGAMAVAEGLRITGCDRRGAVGDGRSPTERLFTDALTGRGSRVRVARSAMCAGCGLTPRSVRWLGPVGSAAAAARLLADRAAPDDPVTLSDALIWRCECRRCGRLPQIVAAEGHRAASVTDRLATCPQCGASSVAIDIRDGCTLAELCERFGEAPLPLAWLRCGEHHVELTPAPVAPDEALNDPWRNT